MVVTTKRDRTVCLLKSWLEACGIPHKVSQNKAFDIQVEKKTGGILDLVIVENLLETSETNYASPGKPPANGWNSFEEIVLDALKVNGLMSLRDLANIIEEFYAKSGTPLLQKDRTSPARNALRRPVGRGIVVKVGSGKYELVEVLKSCISLKMEVLRSKDLEKAFTEFHIATSAAGYGKPTPLDRGAVPTRKLHYTNNFELVSMRHCELRRSPNPSPELLKKYMPVIHKAAWAFLRWNSQACSRHGFEHEDLVQYASMWSINFLANYQVTDLGSNNNERMLCAHLQQRFNNFKEIMEKKARSCLVDRDTYKVATQASVENWNHHQKVSQKSGEDQKSSATHGRASSRSSSWYKIDGQDSEEEIDLDYIARHKEIDVSTDDARRSSAGELLTKLLAELPHDELIHKLRVVYINADKNFDPIAKEEARRQLSSHLKTCTTCTQEILVRPKKYWEFSTSFQKDKDMSGSDSGRAED